MQKYVVFDIETDGLLDTVSKIHVLSYQFEDEDEIRSLYNEQEIKEFIQREDIILVGHNIIGYDLIVLKKLLGVEPKNQPIDTLFLSRYLLAHRSGYKHGLEAYGERFKIPKIEVEDWDTEDIKLYTERCERDVQINTELFKKQLRFLNILYSKNQKHINYVFDYFYWKAYHIAINSTTGIFLDKRNTLKYLHTAEFIFARKTELLVRHMPEKYSGVERAIPQKLYKKDGKLTKIGEQWFEYLKEKGLPENTTVVYKKPNPGSHQQIKSWLFDLGWKPDSFKENDKGEMIPQINLPFGQGLTESVKLLMEEYPFLKHLDNYYKLKHRIGILKGFIAKERNNKLYMTSHALTRSLRLSHSAPLVNMPKPGLYFGDEIRGVLYAPKGWKMIGSDLKALEDKTKQHYIYPYDPEYVNTMQSPDFDPHIDISVLSGLISEEDAKFFKEKAEKENLTNEEKQRLKVIKKKRSSGKTVNFASTYGAGVAKLQATLKSSYSFAKKLWETYWKRNWAIKEVAKSFKIKKVGNIEWIYNPVSKLWLPLKVRKDAFSLINQSTGVFFFDSFVKEIFIEAKKEGKIPNIWLQYHDEVNLIQKEEEVWQFEEILKRAIKKTNAKLNLNVYIDIDIQIGKNYKETH